MQSNMRSSILHHPFEPRFKIYFVSVATLFFALFATNVNVATGQTSEGNRPPQEIESAFRRSQNESESISDVRYARDIRPILSNHCFACHGPDSENQESDLRLDRAEDWKELLDEVGEGVIAPGHPEKSDLIDRIHATDDGEVMPPSDFGKPLSNKQKYLLKLWIKQGAKWEGHWAYQNLQHKPSNLPLNQSIDRLIEFKLAKKGWKRNPQAAPPTLIRRLYLDLTGLPPTVEQANEFVKKPSKANYVRIVDRLLKTNAHAEHLASYWLDWVRFADTVGYHGDQEHPVWPYRDFVIQSFRSNRPFDEFSTLQIAGDLIAEKSNPEEASIAKIASCYNRLLQTTHEGGAQDKEYRAKYLADRVRNFSEVWLGSTMGCAECHDHKFDPFSQKDFYSLGTFFADVLEKGSYDRVSPNSTPTIRPPQRLVISPLSAETLSENEIQSLKAYLVRAPFSSTDSTHTQSLKIWRKQVAEQKKIDKQLLETIKKLNHQRQKESRSPIATGQCMTTVSVKPNVVRVLPRGDWMDESGEITAASPPKHFGNWVKTDARPANRKDLANWLFKKENAIVSRVFVNRIWAIYFGKGISANLGDLGAQGNWPTHPELLDAMAVEFSKSNWNVRHIIREIVLSETYKQSSDLRWNQFQSDPANQLYWRQNPRRVRAETVRDIALFSCGILDQTIGGRSVKPYQPVGYYSNLNFPKRKYRSDKGPAQYRRGLYVHWQRQFLHPMLKAFDAPSREECTAQRPISNTPSAALVLLNDPTFLEAARNLAFESLKDRTKNASDRKDRLSAIFQRILTRRPSPEELTVLEQTLQKELDAFKVSNENALKLLTPGTPFAREKLEKHNIEPYQLAAWTQVVRVILNLDEAITSY